MSLTFFLDGCEIFLWAGERRGSIFGKLTNEIVHHVKRK
jgi:hypothetical protein